MKEGDDFPQEIVAIYDDDPESVETTHAEHFKELVPGLMKNRPPGIQHLPDLALVEQIPISNTAAVDRACGILQEHAMLDFDAEWNTADVTGTGTSSSVLLVQVSALPSTLRHAGANVNPRTKTKWDNCKTRAEMLDLATTLGFARQDPNRYNDMEKGDEFDFYKEHTIPHQSATYYTDLVAKVPKAMLAMTQPAIVFLFRFDKKSNGASAGGPSEVVDVIPDSFAALFASDDIIFGGVNLGGDFTRLEKKYPNFKRKVLLDLGKATFHGGDSNAMSLKALALDICDIRVYKPPSLRLWDWSGHLAAMWIHYAALDALLCGYIVLFQQMGKEYGVERVKEMFGAVIEATWIEKLVAYNRCKKDYNHVYRHKMGLVSTDHPVGSTMGWFWAKAFRKKEESSVKDEQQRLRETGKYSEDQILAMNFYSTQMRVEQYAPQKEELHARALEVWNVFKMTPPFKGQTLFKNFEEAKKYIEECLLVDVQRDRFSDPPGEPMYMRRECDDKLLSSRETAKQESMHRWYRTMFPAGRYGIRLHVMLSGRFSSRWNMTQGNKNLGWDKLEHSNLPLAIRRNRFERSAYPELKRTFGGVWH